MFLLAACAPPAAPGPPEDTGVDGEQPANGVDDDGDGEIDELPDPDRSHPARVVDVAAPTDGGWWVVDADVGYSERVAVYPPPGRPVLGPVLLRLVHRLPLVRRDPTRLRPRRRPGRAALHRGERPIDPDRPRRGGAARGGGHHPARPGRHGAGRRRGPGQHHGRRRRRHGDARADRHPELVRGRGHRPRRRRQPGPRPLCDPADGYRDLALWSWDTRLPDGSVGGKGSELHLGIGG